MKRIIIELNGLLGINNVAKKHDWNKNHFKPKFNCNWDNISYTNYPQWAKWFLIPIGNKLKDIEGYQKILRIFRDLPPQWIQPQVTTYNRSGLGRTPTIDLNMSVVNKIKTTIKLARRFGFDKVMISMFDNCSQRERGWRDHYYSDEWWNKYHVPHIEKLTNEFAKAGLQEHVIAEVCNEGHGWFSSFSSWESHGAEFLRGLGYNIVSSSPERFFDDVLDQNVMDFMCYHGIWKTAKWKYYIENYYNIEYGDKVIPSGDGFSDCWYPYSGTLKYQFDEKRYGKLPNKAHVKRQFKKCQNIGIDLNGSGAIESTHPALGIIGGWLDGIKEIL